MKAAGDNTSSVKGLGVAGVVKVNIRDDEITLNPGVAFSYAIADGKFGSVLVGAEGSYYSLVDTAAVGREIRGGTAQGFIEGRYSLIHESSITPFIGFKVAFGAAFLRDMKQNLILSGAALAGVEFPSENSGGWSASFAFGGDALIPTDVAHSSISLDAVSAAVGYRF